MHSLYLITVMMAAPKGVSCQHSKISCTSEMNKYDQGAYGGSLQGGGGALRTFWAKIGAHDVIRVSKIRR